MIARRTSCAASSRNSTQLLSLTQPACGVMMQLGASLRGELVYEKGSEACESEKTTKIK